MSNQLGSMRTPSRMDQVLFYSLKWKAPQRPRANNSFPKRQSIEIEEDGYIAKVTYCISKTTTGVTPTCRESVWPDQCQSVCSWVYVKVLIYFIHWGAECFVTKRTTWCSVHCSEQCIGLPALTIIITDGLVLIPLNLLSNQWNRLPYMAVSLKIEVFIEPIAQAKQAMGHLRTYWWAATYSYSWLGSQLDVPFPFQFFWLVALCQLLIYFLSVVYHPSVLVSVRLGLGLCTSHFSFVSAIRFCW